MCLQYEVVRKATITYRPYHRNYYHSLAEAIFAVHLLACTYFQYCQHGDGSDLTAVFIDTIDDPVDWDTTLQSAIEALQCLTPRPAYTIKDPKLHDRVGVTLQSLTPPLVPLCIAISCSLKQPLPHCCVFIIRPLSSTADKCYGLVTLTVRCSPVSAIMTAAFLLPCTHSLLTCGYS